MRLINQTRNTVLAENVFFANSPFRRIKGLLGCKFFPDGQALVIKPCNCIHTLFMRFPIDVLFVGKDNLVVKALPQLRSFRFSKLYWKSCMVIELPSGKLEATQTQDGDILQVIK